MILCSCNNINHTKIEGVAEELFNQGKKVTANAVFEVITGRAYDKEFWDCMTCISSFKEQISDILKTLTHIPLDDAA